MYNSIVWLVGVLDINFLPSYLSYFYQVTWDICLHENIFETMRYVR
jgi:hypothetical protein